MSDGKPQASSELIEPLKKFLESFTQELTEQQFIPAFRDELRRLLSALDNIQQSGETLQQIARGVDRLREVFAPAGTRMLEGVRELEGLMKSNADVLKGRADGILDELLSTHSKLENALRQEAGLLQEQTSVGRETLVRTAGEIEERLSGLTSQIENLCRKTETQLTQISSITARTGDQVVPMSAPVAITSDTPLKVDISEDLGRLFAKNETLVSGELTRYQSEMRELLSSNTKENTERLAKIDRTVDDALKSVGPRVQEELDQALERLRDQIAALATVEAEVKAAKSTEGHKSDEAATAATTAALSKSLAATENRLLKELGEQRKNSKTELSSTQKAIQNLALDMSEVTEKHAERLIKETAVIKDSLAKAEREMKEMLNGEEHIAKRVQEILLGVLTFNDAAEKRDQFLTEKFDATDRGLESTTKGIEKLQGESHQVLTSVKSGLSRIEETANRVGEAVQAEGRVQREKIESGLIDLRQRVEQRLDTGSENYAAAMKELMEQWAITLRALSNEIDQRISAASESVIGKFGGVEEALHETGRRTDALSKDLQTELKRSSSQIFERIEKFQGFQKNTEQLTSALAGHVKAVSGEVSGMRAKQEESIAVLKEAIRVNYDDNAARLKEVIEGAYDNFVNQIHSIPQSLERYAKLMESMHQGEKLALDGISKETGNILKLSNVLVGDGDAMKKIFPLMDKKLEKQGQAMDALRNSQIKQSKDIEVLQKSLKEGHVESTRWLSDLKGEMKQFEAAAYTKFTEQSQMQQITYDEIEKLEKTELPSFRRELNSLLVSKFEFVEITLNERQSALRSELFNLLEKERKRSDKIYMGLAVLGILSIAVQFAMNSPTLLKLIP